MSRATAPVLRVVEREVRVFSRLWRGFVFSLFLNPVLYLAAMGLGLGGLVDKHSGNVEGLTYLQFVTPGLLVAVAAQLAAGESMWPIVGGVKWIGNFHATVATAITPAEVLYGCVLWIAIRAMIGSVAFLLVAAVLGGIPSAWGILAIPVAGLCAAAFSAPLCAYSVMKDSDLSFPLILRIGVLPLFLFSGTFYPISQLPAALQPIAQLSPLYHAVALARAATTDTFDAGPDLVHLAVLVAFVLAGLAWGRRRFAQRLAA
jgi:lipooligosaccharide transport system permease protein